MHMVSEVSGQLEQKYSTIDALKACFPAGTVSGAPKVRAMEIIHELEAVKRESYAGSVGYIDFQGNMDNVHRNSHDSKSKVSSATIRAGAGIVADSVPVERIW